MVIFGSFCVQKGRVHRGQNWGLEKGLILALRGSSLEGKMTKNGHFLRFARFSRAFGSFSGATLTYFCRFSDPEIWSRNLESRYRDFFRDFQKNRDFGFRGTDSGRHFWPTRKNVTKLTTFILVVVEEEGAPLNAAQSGRRNSALPDNFRPFFGPPGRGQELDTVRLYTTPLRGGFWQKGLKF